MTYNDAVLWRNKYEALKKEQERTQAILKESLLHNMKLIKISNTIKVNEFSAEYKIALINEILAEEVLIRNEI